MISGSGPKQVSWVDRLNFHLKPVGYGSKQLCKKLAKTHHLGGKVKKTVVFKSFSF